MVLDVDDNCHGHDEIVRGNKMKQRDVTEFRQNLERWYAKNKRYMPWRVTKNPYHIWISEVMLQQTQVATVIDYFNRFIAAFPDIESLAAAPLEHVLKLWEGLGYYSRARNLHYAVNQLVGQGCRGVPDTPETFRHLKGVGDYINAAVQSIAFGHPLSVVDGNVKRVIARLMIIDTPVNHSNAHKIYVAHADKLLNRHDPSTFNQAMMELGALICKPRNPKCEDCPVGFCCKAFEKKCTDIYPKRVPPKKIPIRRKAAALVLKDDRFLILRRPAEGFLGGMWELPTTDIVPGEDIQTCLASAIGKHAELSIRAMDLLTTINHSYTHFKLVMSLWLVEIHPPILPGPSNSRRKWIGLEDIEEYPFHKAIHKCFPAIQEAINSQTRSHQGAITYRPGAA